MISVSTLLANAANYPGAYVFTAGCSCKSSTCAAAACSSYISWVVCRSGGSFTNGSWLQYRACRAAGLTTTPERALRTPGALLFKFSSSPLVGGRPNEAHVVISAGNNSQTYECKGRAYGCGTFSGAASRGWTHAGLIPGVDYSSYPGPEQGAAGGATDVPPSLEWAPPPTVGPPPVPPPPPPPPSNVAIYAGLPDEIENILGSKTCGRRTDVKMFHRPSGNTAEIWIGNGVLKAYISEAAYPGVLQRGVQLITISQEEFDGMLDVSGW